jgi:leucyl aminopeptidase
MFSYLLLLRLIIAYGSEDYQISVAPGIEQTMSQEELFSQYLNRNHGKPFQYIDTTDGTWQEIEILKIDDHHRKSPFPTELSNQELVESLKKKIDDDYMTHLLSILGSFHNRYFRNRNGKKVSDFIYNHLRQLNGFIKRKDLELIITKVDHSWDQYSIIARLQPVKVLNDEIVVLGSHIDAFNEKNPSSGRAPGLDEASGIASTLAVLSVLCTDSAYVPSRPVEFHFYAASQSGLKGSQQIVRDYLINKTRVHAMLQTDMVGYIGSKKYAIVTDNVDRHLVDFLKLIADQYLNIPIVTTTCGFACSDHQSWRQGGYPSVFHLEDTIENINPFLQTEEDDFQHFSLEHMLQFAYATLGFAVELSISHQNHGGFWKSLGSLILF